MAPQERQQMAAPVSRKLSNSFEGALAGGGDPATSPLYVLGPFLQLVVVAGVASVTFGASIWLVVLTVAAVSAMYRLVMRWVTDGSGGSGLSEEEFGGWAVKVNAAITFIEYTLTFLVSMAALVTFIADRVPLLNETLVAGIQYRKGVSVRPVVTGSQPARTIVEVAEQENAGLVMLATHGRGGLDRLFVGSVADRVIHDTTCPVFLVPCMRNGLQRNRCDVNPDTWPWMCNHTVHREALLRAAAAAGRHRRLSLAAGFVHRADHLPAAERQNREHAATQNSRDHGGSQWPLKSQSTHLSKSTVHSRSANTPQLSSPRLRSLAALSGQATRPFAAWPAISSATTAAAPPSP
jgi:nucleotide-binding universal stress UspA family protein